MHLHKNQWCLKWPLVVDAFINGGEHALSPKSIAHFQVFERIRCTFRGGTMQGGTSEAWEAYRASDKNKWESEGSQTQAVRLTHCSPPLMCSYLDFWSLSDQLDGPRYPAEGLAIKPPASDIDRLTPWSLTHPLLQQFFFKQSILFPLICGLLNAVSLLNSDCHGEFYALRFQRSAPYLTRVLLWQQVLGTSSCFPKSDFISPVLCCCCEARRGSLGGSLQLSYNKCSGLFDWVEGLAVL